MTTPSSDGMSGEMRTSCARPHAWVTEAILSTTMVLTSAVSLRTPVEYSRERRDLRESERIGRGPLACRFAVHTLRGAHERVRRVDSLDEDAARPQEHVHVARHALLRGDEQRLDVAADRIEELALVHEIAIGLGDELLDALLPAGEHELLELAVRGEEQLGGRRLEGDATLRADDGVAEMDAAADAEGRRSRLERFDQRNGPERAAIERRWSSAQERDGVPFGLARPRERLAREHPGLLG